MFGPLATLGSGAGLSASSSANSQVGATSIGPYNFSPKGSALPPVAWIAIGAVVLLVLLKRVR
jgi:hypothetical protein